MDNKKILFSDSARAGLKKGIDIVANAVKVTLGYGGRTVVISETGLPSRTTKDGVTVAKHIKLRDEIEDAGAKFIQEVSSKTADDVGDGTTTVCVLMQSMIENGLKLIASGANPMVIKKEMDTALIKVVDRLKQMKIEITDRLLQDVATVSANNDAEIGELISSAYKQLGPHGIIYIEDANGPDTKIEMTEGFKFDSGYFSHHFINNHAENICELKNPYVMIVENKINDVNQIWNLLQKVAKEGRSIVIIAEDFDHSVPANLLKNRELIKSCLIKYNFIGDTKQELMYDLCGVTGATIAEKQADKMENLKVEYLGECEKIIIGQNETLIVKGRKSEKELQSRIADAKVKIEKAKHPFIKQKQEIRMARLSGCVAICYVGGITEVEVSEKKDRIDDSIKATKAAIEEGVVVGGGTALLRCSDSIGKEGGEWVVRMALKEPAEQICKNVGIEDWPIIVSSVKQNGTGIENNGYNAISDRIENMVEAGIVDPLKVVRVCIENAVSAAGQVLISEALIVTDNQ